MKCANSTLVKNAEHAKQVDIPIPSASPRLVSGNLQARMPTIAMPHGGTWAGDVGVAMKQIKLHLGCGRDYRDEWINLDTPTSDVRADVYHDLNQLPWPFPDEYADHVEMFSVIEHLRDTVLVMTELHRILKPGGTVHIYTAYFKSDDAFLDPTHVTFFHKLSMRYFEDGDPYNFYSKTRFNVISSRLTSQSDTLAKKIRNMIPFRPILARFLWNMYDGVDYVLNKPA